MKQVILSLVAAVMAVTMGAQNPAQSPAETPAQGSGQENTAGRVWPQSNRSVSTTLGLNVEFGDEWAIAGRATVLARVGLVSRDWTLRNSFGNFYWATSLVPGLTLEPRYYFVFQGHDVLAGWRNFFSDLSGSLKNLNENYGPFTAGNSAEFIGVPVTVTLAKNGKGLGEVAVSPVLGFRQLFGKCWFHELTLGGDLLCYPSLMLTPHVGYRIGFLF